jgi:RNA polymerase sigma-70 factor (ECF subfamily)
MSPEFLELLVEEHYQALYRFAHSLSGNAADAADLTQQAFYIAQIKGSQMRQPARAKSWLFTTLMREFLQKRRRETRFLSLELEQVEDELPWQSFDHVASIDSASVVEALQKLPESFRAPLALFYLEDMPYLEIARVLGLPKGTVMSRLARAKARLRQSLEQGYSVACTPRQLRPPPVAAFRPIGGLAGDLKHVLMLLRLSATFRLTLRLDEGRKRRRCKSSGFWPRRRIARAWLCTW